MKSIEERVHALLKKHDNWTIMVRSVLVAALREGLTELAADLNAEKEKEVAELKTAIQELSNSKVSGDQRCAKYIGEIAELQAWKESALKVMPDFQKLGKLLGLPIGSSVSEQLVPAVEKQTALLDEVKRVLSWYVGNQEPDWECACEQCRNHAAAHSLLTRLGGASHE